MQKQTSLYIPKPCHEDWNKMTPTQQGKFCGSCSKQVIDFSLMSDNQVLNFLSQQSGKLCGRFDAEQLQRPLIETKIKKKKSWWMALTMPLLFLFERSEAQTNVSNKEDTIIQVNERKDLIVGKLIYNPMKQTTISGKVVDENNDPLGYVSINKKGTKQGVVTDSLGNFSININSEDSVVTLVASYVGYETIEKQIQAEKTDTVNITLQMSEYTTGGLIAIVTVDSIWAYDSMNIIDTIKTAVKKALNISAFKIYPNPIIKGNTIYLEIKQPAEYQLQVLDNQSRLIQTEEIDTNSDNSTKQIQLNSNIAAGIYYLRLINEQSKKQYTKKFIVQ